MELNERLRELRKEQGETQKQVAAAIGIGERPYQYLESGEHRPSLDTLIALADHFGVSLDYPGRPVGPAGVVKGRRPAASGIFAPARGLFSGMHPPFSFRSCPKRKRAVHGPKRKALARSGAVALRATGGGGSVQAPIWPGLRARYTLLRFS